MDWDGVGTFAMFIATGGVGVCLVALRAYKAKLASQIEIERIRGQSAEAQSEEVAERMLRLEAVVGRLAERTEFTERLLTDRSEAPSEVDSPATE